jgi:hypothetical protein
MRSLVLLYCNRGETRERVAWHRFQVGQTDHGPSNEKSRLFYCIVEKPGNALRGIVFKWVKPGFLKTLIESS